MTCYICHSIWKKSEFWTLGTSKGDSNHSPRISSGHYGRVALALPSSLHNQKQPQYTNNLKTYIRSKTQETISIGFQTLYNTRVATNIVYSESSR